MGKHQGLAWVFSYLCENSLPVFEMGESNFLGQPAMWGLVGIWWGAPGLSHPCSCACPALQKCLENVLSWNPQMISKPCPAPCAAQAVLLAGGTAWALCLHSFPPLIRWWAAFSWHRNVGREGMPSFGAGTEERLCCRAGHEALCSLPFLMHVHLASAFQGEENQLERAVLSNLLFFKTQRKRSEGSYPSSCHFRALGSGKMGEGQVPPE